jgi:protein-S-isoprenylcysteine O-methyltransferase Ste14
MWLALWTALAVPTLVVLLRVNAPYGRHARRGWGPAVPARVAWIVMEAPAALGMVALYVAARPAGAVPVVLLGMWLLHYANRAFVYPLRARGGTPMPASVAGMGFVFNCVNVWVQGSAAFAPRAYADTWLRDPRFVVGAVMFLAGWAANRHADAVLRRLRRGGYQIPRGGLYRWVSCPNYLGEIAEWIGWAVATWSLAGVSFAVWTVANLVPRALANHRWMKERFPDYPPERKAIVPYVL